MSYKKLKNNESFQFDENDVLPAPSVSAFKKRRSVQERLAPKAGSLGHCARSFGGRGGGMGVYSNKKSLSFLDPSR